MKSSEIALISPVEFSGIKFCNLANDKLKLKSWLLIKFFPNEVQKGNEARHTQSKSEVIKYKLLTAIKAENPKKGEEKETNQEERIVNCVLQAKQVVVKSRVAVVCWCKKKKNNKKQPKHFVWIFLANLPEILLCYNCWTCFKEILIRTSSLLITNKIIVLCVQN